MKRVDLAGLAVESTSGVPIVLLREQDEPHRLLPIFIGGTEAASIALAISGEVPPRPLTHDLMVTLVEQLDARIDAVEVTEVTDGAFLATLALHGPTGEQRLDTRPSDAIALALRLGAPMYVSDAVLDEAGTLPAAGEIEIELDEAVIDEEVEQFREFLDELDPAQFLDGDEDAG